MDRIDYRDVYRELYRPHGDGPLVADLPPMHCLALSDSERCTARATALRAVAEAVRIDLHRGPMALNFRLMPLEYALGEEWRIMQPPVVSAAMAAEAIAAVTERDPEAADTRFLRRSEGRLIQARIAGRPLEIVDAELAAFAAAHDLVPIGPPIIVAADVMADQQWLRLEVEPTRQARR